MEVQASISEWSSDVLIKPTCPYQNPNTNIRPKPLNPNFEAVTALNPGKKHLNPEGFFLGFRGLGDYKA